MLVVLFVTLLNEIFSLIMFFMFQAPQKILFLSINWHPIIMLISNFIHIFSLLRTEQRGEPFWKEHVEGVYILYQLPPSRINKPSTRPVVLIPPWKDGIIA